MQEPQFLSAEQVLMTTLVVKLAVMAALATMLVRYRRFRHILIFERRDWPDRLIFVLSLGVPLTAGVASRLLLGYKAADLTLEGAFLAGLIAGPYAGAIVGVMVGLPPLASGELIALPFAVGCGFAGGGLRELCPKESIWHFSPFIFTGLHRRAWKMMRSLDVDWQVVLLPVYIEAPHHFPCAAMQAGEDEWREVPDRFLRAQFAQAASSEPAADREGQRDELAARQRRKPDHHANDRAGVR